MKRIEWTTYALAVAANLYVIRTLPESPLHHPLEPTYLASLSSIAVILLLGASRFAARGRRIDRQILAVFLGGMPVVYAWAAILRGNTVDLAVEAIGILIFGGAAIVGYRRVPWLLGAGIIAHGLAWDAWHHGRSAFIADWYSAGCMIVDLGIGLYALARLTGSRGFHGSTRWRSTG
jgi:hypothetical protein